MEIPGTGLTTVVISQDREWHTVAYGTGSTPCFQSHGIAAAAILSITTYYSVGIIYSYNENAVSNIFVSDHNTR